MASAPWPCSSSTASRLRVMTLSTVSICRSEINKVLLLLVFGVLIIHCPGRAVGVRPEALLITIRLLKDWAPGVLLVGFFQKFFKNLQWVSFQSAGRQACFFCL